MRKWENSIGSSIYFLTFAIFTVRIPCQYVALIYYPRKSAKTHYLFIGKSTTFVKEETSGQIMCPPQPLFGEKKVILEIHAMILIQVGRQK